MLAPSPPLGIIYCTLIEVCTKITVLDNLSNRFDVRKAIIAWRALCSSGVAMFEENKIP